MKILSGDDPVVVKRLAGLVGLHFETVLSGSDIAELSDEALAVQVQTVDAYGRLAPDQKSRLIKALQSRGEVVGFLGDGINDAPALKVADIGLSVDGATGVAQAAADMILLAPDLEVVADGVEEGRRTFANILKYVRMGASSNFGNMLSMAVASLFLPFLPMLPTQILLNNLLYDLSEIGIPFDSVRPEATARPQVWDMRDLMRFAGVMGPLSSALRLLTFAGLLLIFHAAPEEFRTAWFLESMATQILVIFIIRTNGRPWSNRPHPALRFVAARACGGDDRAVLAARRMVRLPGRRRSRSPASVGLIVVAYLVCAELVKRFAVGDQLAPARAVRRGRAPLMDAAHRRPRIVRGTSARSRAAVVEIVPRPPAEFAPDLRGVDGVARIVARPVGDELDQLLVRPVRAVGQHLVEQAADRAHDVDVLAARCRRRHCRSRPAGPCAAPGSAPRHGPRHAASRARSRPCRRPAGSRRAARG